MKQPVDNTMLILNQFSPLKRAHVMTWLNQHQYSLRSHHNGFLNALDGLRRYHATPFALPLQAKIAFVLLSEFGPQFSQRKCYRYLIQRIENRLTQKLALETV